MNKPGIPFNPLLDMPNGLTLVRKDAEYNPKELISSSGKYQPVVEYSVVKTVPGLSHDEYKKLLLQGNPQSVLRFQYDAENEVWRPDHIHVHPVNQRKGVYTNLLKHMSSIADIASSGTDPNETSPHAAKAWNKLGAKVEKLLPAISHNAGAGENLEAFVIRKSNPILKMGKKR